MSYNKYKHKKTIVDGIKFDSEMESHYYIYLKHLKEIGEVVDFVLQPHLSATRGVKEVMRYEK